MLASIALSSMLFVSCNDVIYDEQGDCSVSYAVKFVYDYNMKWADAFGSEVESVTLYLLDNDGNIVWQNSESGQALKAEGYTMNVDVAPGTYHLLAWGSEENPKTFDFGARDTRNNLTAKLNRTVENDNLSHVRGEVDNLYYGYMADVEFPDKYGDHVVTLKMMKDTNDLHVVVQTIGDEELPEGALRYEVTEDNGFLNWNNELLQDDLLTYHPWYTGAGSADITVNDQQQSIYSTSTADFRVSRLMASHSTKSTTRLKIINNETGDNVISLNLIDALLMVKSHYYDKDQKRELSNQEYLDRQDNYSLVFFVTPSTEKGNWICTSIYINSWHVILNDVTVGS